MAFKKGEVPEGAKVFEKGVSGNPSGRPPKVLHFFKKSEYNKQDFKEAVQALFWMDMNELKLLFESGEVNGKAVPAVVKMLAGMVWESTTNRDMSKVRDLIKYIAPNDEELGNLGNQVNEIIFRLAGGDGMVKDAPKNPLDYSMNENE